MVKTSKNKQIINNCNLFKYINLLGKKWTLFILLKLYQNKNKKVNFSEFKEEISGITSKVLTERLTELIKFKIIEKKIEKKNNINYTNYYLTEKGEKLKSTITAFIKWNKKFNKCKYEKFCEIK